MTTAYEDVIEFLARGITPHELAAFTPSAEARERFEWLIGKEKSEGLLHEEREELDRSMGIERVLSLAKARAGPGSHRVAHEQDAYSWRLVQRKLRRNLPTPQAKWLDRLEAES